MIGAYALGASPGAEGVPFEGVYFNRGSSVVAGPSGALFAGPGGVSIGRFGWVDPQGIVRNARNSPGDLLGLAVVQYADWRRVFWDEITQTWRIREGFNMTLLARAPGITTRIRGGCDAPYRRIYADPVDGSVVAAYADGLEVTPWATVGPAAAGALTYITTWNPVSS